MFDVIPLPNSRIGRSKIPEDIYNNIMSEIKEIQNCGSPNKWNKELAGAIEKEYLLIKSRSFLVSFLKDMAAEYVDCEIKNLYEYGLLPTPDDARRSETKAEFEVLQIWVNYQQKNEYNPIHNHGGDFSFVLWMEIPFKHSDECKVKNVVNSNSGLNASNFEFIYSDILGKINTYSFPVESGWEGRIIMFPAKLLHIVYPFQTSDGYRISISGNLNRVN